MTYVHYCRRFFATKFVPFSVHPLLPVALFFMFGIWLQSAGYPLYILVGAWMFGLLLTLATRSFLPFVLATALLCGATLYQRTINRFVAFYDCIAEKSVDLSLTVTDIARSDHRYLKHRITGKIETITCNSSSVHHGNQAIIWYTKYRPAIFVADTIMLKNVVINQPKEASMKHYFFKQSVAGTIVSSAYELTNRPSFSLARLLFEYRLSVFGALKQKVSKNTFLFMSLLFFGNKEINKKELLPLQQACKTWGISHYLARSGLHLIIFILLWEYVFKLFPLSFLLKQLLICLLALLYMLFTWPSISFARSFAGFVAYKLGTLYHQQIHPVHLITVITCCALASNPLHLFFLDFQLSFGITFLLTWANYVATQQKLPVSQNSCYNQAHSPKLHLNYN